MALTPIIDQGFGLQVYAKEFHMEPPHVNSKTLTSKGKSLV